MDVVVFPTESVAVTVKVWMLPGWALVVSMGDPTATVPVHDVMVTTGSAQVYAAGTDWP
jgi:hypothetical protein